jgi:hypothetical protein
MLCEGFTHHSKKANEFFYWHVFGWFCKQLLHGENLLKNVFFQNKIVFLPAKKFTTFAKVWNLKKKNTLILSLGKLIKAGRQANIQGWWFFFRLSYLVRSQIWLKSSYGWWPLRLTSQNCQKKKKKKKREKRGKKKTPNNSFELKIKQKGFYYWKPNLVWPEKLTVNANSNLVGVLFPIPTTQEWSCLKTRSFGLFLGTKNYQYIKTKYKSTKKSPFLLTSLK